MTVVFNCDSTEQKNAEVLVVAGKVIRLEVTADKICA